MCRQERKEYTSFYIDTLRLAYLRAKREIILYTFLVHIIFIIVLSALLLNFDEFCFSTIDDFSRFYNLSHVTISEVPRILDCDIKKSEFVIFSSNASSYGVALLGSSDDVDFEISIWKKQLFVVNVLYSIFGLLSVLFLLRTYALNMFRIIVWYFAVVPDWRGRARKCVNDFFVFYSVVVFAILGVIYLAFEVLWSTESLRCNVCIKEISIYGDTRSVAFGWTIFVLMLLSLIYTSVLSLVYMYCIAKHKDFVRINMVRDREISTLYLEEKHLI